MIAGMADLGPVLALMMEIPDARAFLAFSALLGVGAATMWPALCARRRIDAARTAHADDDAADLAQMAGIGLARWPACCWWTS